MWVSMSFTTVLFMNKFISYAKQSIDESDVSAVSEAMRGSSITRGAQVEAFERAVADYCSANHAVAFSSGSAALLAACSVANVSKFDRVVTSPNTFVATVTAGLHHGAEPLFIDVDRRTGNLDLDLVEKHGDYVSSRGHNIYIPVHFSGIPVDVKRLESLVKDPEAIIIEDAAHALGSCYSDGQKVGCCAWSDMTVLSFHPAKNMTTGEGGMVLTHDPELYHQLRVFRNSGIETDPSRLSQQFYPGYYEVMKLASNYHMTDLQAALGLSQLKRLDQFIAKRRQRMKCYREQLKAETSIRFFDALDHAVPNLCVVQIDFAAYKTDRKQVMEKLKEKGIGTQVHYIPVYRHPFFTRTHPEISSYFPETEAYYSQALTLPLYPDLTEEDVLMVTKTLKDILHSSREAKS